MKAAADCDTIMKILCDRSVVTNGFEGYYISRQDYADLIDALEEREIAFRTELRAEIIELKKLLKEKE